MSASLTWRRCKSPVRVVHAAALSLEVREQPDRPLLETLTDHLQAQSLLLILDNCEHLSATCASLAEALLARCPRLQLLATLRQSLGIAGERAWRLPSLTLPEGSKREWEKEKEAPAVLMGSEAVQLFVERGTSAHPAFHLTRRTSSARRRYAVCWTASHWRWRWQRRGCG